MTAKTVNCENCEHFREIILECKTYVHSCKLGKRIRFITTHLPGIKDDPGYRRKCNDFKAKEATHEQ